MKRLLQSHHKRTKRTKPPMEYVRFFIEKTGHFVGSAQVRFRMETTDFIGDLVSRFAKGGVFSTSSFKGEVNSLDAVEGVESDGGCGRLIGFKEEQECRI
jgi:hypothetical protein